MKKFIYLLFMCFGCIRVDPEGSKNNAMGYAKELGYNPLGAACSSADSDGDGYVSCTVRLGDGEPPLALECQWLFGEGCKMALPKFRK